MGSLRTGVASLVALLVLAGCPNKPKPDEKTKSEGTRGASSAPLAATPVAETLGDGVRGKELVLTFQCNRCHEGTGHPAAEDNKHCVRCHEKIMSATIDAPIASIVRWKPRVEGLTASPSLEATGNRFTRKWVTSFLLRPSDLRPHLHQHMPRLAMTPEQARDIAAYLVPEPDPPPSTPTALAGADMGKGRRLLETKGCGSCHVFSGVSALEASAPPPMDAKEFERGYKLAPDLRVARERMSASKMIAWLADPKRVKKDTPMPSIALSQAELRDLAAYILTAELTPTPAKAPVARLPVLERKVTYKEVDEKVFHRTCWHCHSEPDYAIGDGGPGNSGGFGFKPRGLDLSHYNGIAAGYLDDRGERASVFARDTENVPRLVRALLARHDEESGAETGSVRGMPLGYEPLSLEDIQLVETWIAQGRPR